MTALSVAVFDTNIVIDLIALHPKALEEVQNCTKSVISIMTWMEVLVGAKTITEESRLRRAMQDVFTIIPIDDDISERAIVIRREKRIRMPDAIIWATAQFLHAPLYTRNTRDFPEGTPGVHVPYQIG